MLKHSREANKFKILKYQSRFYEYSHLRPYGPGARSSKGDIIAIMYRS